MNEFDEFQLLGCFLFFWGIHILKVSNWLSGALEQFQADLGGNLDDGDKPGQYQIHVT